MEELASPEGAIRAVMEGEQTKTSVTDAGSFTWSTGDQVWLQTTNGSVVGTLSSGAGSPVASFSHVSFIGELTGKAAYPYNAGHSVSSDELTFVLPASYDLGTNLTNTNAAMYGVDVNGTIRFNHLAGVMRFIFKNAPVGTDKFQITLDKKINGSFIADITQDYPIIETASASSDLEKTVTMNFDPLTSVSDISLYVPLPVGTYTTLNLDLWAGEKSVWTYSNTVTNTISRKTLKLMPVVTLEGSVDGELEDAVNLSENGTANSYIVSEAGSYKFTPTKGNSSESVGSIASAEVLWETFGTDVTPNVGDLVKNVKYANGVISFETPATFKEGNAVIAAKDANGTILWSWHIWLTDQPEGQVYYNNAGTMMDRNLGATSATPGDVGALGLLYQWGRKDPFLGYSSIRYYDSPEAKSTITWPYSVRSKSSTGTIAYATANPTTFITANNGNDDWYYSGANQTNNTRWTTSDTDKSIYDPCPAGWRVPDGGGNGVWSKALGLSSNFDYTYNYTNRGVNFSGKFGSASTIWYPASGCRTYNYGSLSNVVGSRGCCWSASPYTINAYVLDFDGYSVGGHVDPSDRYERAGAYSVRCLQESSVSDEPEGPQYIDLSEDATANSYIVSEAGSYKFTPTKGNSSESVGAIASAEVLWETFGTDVTPNVGDLVKNVKYANGVISFETPATFKEGNAVIAAKDANGTILWSWHIWLTDQPEGQVYYNNAGTMMDRNLGATSATPGDVGALGLLYQWGRKDPFLGSSSIQKGSMTGANSTITWPSAVSSDSSNGTVAFATANPTTFIWSNSSNYYDWYYTGSTSTDNTRWTTSDTDKSIYDPCPAGWRVPDGGGNGVWSKALDSGSDFTQSSLYDSTNEGLNFSGMFGCASTIWYPASGYRYSVGGSLRNVGYSGFYWSASPNNYHTYGLYFDYGGDVSPSSYYARAGGQSVRCLQAID